MFRMEKEGTAIFDKVIPQMGGFHIVLCMTRTIYSRFKHAGIVELFSSSELGGKGTIKKALKVGDTKEVIYLYKLLFETFLRSKVEHLKKSNELLPTVPEIPDICQSDIDSALDKGFIETLPNLKGDMALWIESLIEIINMLINTIHFQRVGNCKGFLVAIRQFLPYCFNHNCHNYAHNLSYFYCHMHKLEKDKEKAYIFMLKGGFSGSLMGKPHSRIPMDQIIETTVNRWPKEVGGICGKTDNNGATER